MAPNSDCHDPDRAAVPTPERRPILLRAYAEPIIKEPKDKPNKRPEWVLIFDTETRTDASQRLRFGAYQLLAHGMVHEAGLFYDDVSPEELGILEVEAARRKCALRNASEFIHAMFFPAAYKAGALVVGFNLPFDISRLAIHQDTARVSRAPRSKEEIIAGAPLKKADRFMAGGFTLQLSPFDDKPRLRVKHRNSRSSFFSFAKPAHQDAARSVRGRREKVRFEKGNFLDVRTLAAALTSTSHSLESLAEYLGVQHKGKFTDFGRAIDAEFVDYAINDVETTRQCFVELVRRYDQHQLATPPQSIHSEAGLGKAYLEQMGIQPWREVQPNFDPATIGAIMSSYFGGRAEVHIRRTIVPTIYCDFASMYPTVCTLMGLWRFVIAKGIGEVEASAEAQAILDGIELDNLQARETWANLTTLVQVQPNADIFPVRAHYAPNLKGETKSSRGSNIGVNYLSADQPLWFTMADCVASKLLTGKAPKVVKAIRFVPQSPQRGMKPINLAGNAELQIEPCRDDFFKSVIDLRRRVKRELSALKREAPDSPDISRLDMDQLALKILANSTSYGIFIELNAETVDEVDQHFEIFTSQGQRQVESAKRETPGRFYHPLLATLITGAARLMLALSERLAINHDLNWAFCDTDSMAFANTAGLAQADFEKRVHKICDWFTPLNPYEAAPGKRPESILEMEEENFGKQGQVEPLFALAISAKRYALFNLNEEGEPVIRKASAHGLGHIYAPYGDEDESRGERTSGVRLWEEDLWREIIAATRSSETKPVNFAFRPELAQPARSRYSATKPATLDWFKQYNAGRPYCDQVKPFNFMLSFFPKRQEDLVVVDPTRDWDQALREVKPVAPFEKDLAKCLQHVFDRDSETLEPVPVEQLRTVADVLRDYHRQPEYKFLGGGWADTGILRRRHVFAETVEDIGKESDGWEETEAQTEGQDPVLRYPPSAIDRGKMIELIKSVGKRALRAEMRIAMRTINAVYVDASNVSDSQLIRMANAAQRIVQQESDSRRAAAEALDWLRQETMLRGLQSSAEMVNLDTSNLAKIVAGKRNLSARLVRHISQLWARDGQEA